MDNIEKLISEVYKRICRHSKQEYSDTQSTIEMVIEMLNNIDYIPFPVSLSTVDMSPYFVDHNGDIYILLGRKPKQEKHQFLGGFRDVRESNEQAAVRELHEEGGVLLDLQRAKYLTSMFIDDKRYKDSIHKVTTSVFTFQFSANEKSWAKPGDDIGEVNWFRLDDLIKDDNYKNVIREIHHQIFLQIKEYHAKRIATTNV